MQKSLEELIKSKPGYIKKSASYVAELLGIEPTYDNVMDIKHDMKKLRKKMNNVITIDLDAIPRFDSEQWIKEMSKNSLTTFRANIKKKKNVLVIGDIHEPFTLEGYLEFCKEQYIRFNCDTVVFIGDIIDNAFSSFHPTNPDGYGAGDELDRAIDKISLWYNTFPEATVIIGNHDRLAYRKAFAGGISSRWIREYKDVLNTPGWTFTESITIDNVFYCHGEAGTARTKAKDTSRSTVQGHLHSQAYVEYINNRIFAAQVGTGIDDSSYAFNYNKAGKESILSCLVVEQGIQPFLIKK